MAAEIENIQTADETPVVSSDSAAEVEQVEPSLAANPAETAGAEGDIAAAPSGPVAEAKEPIPGPKTVPNVKQLLKMKVPVIVKVTEKKVRLKDILKWNLGSIIVFEKDAYQNIDLMVNNSTIGLGQPVKIGEKFGLKITQIKDPAETIRSLGPALSGLSGA